MEVFRFNRQIITFNLRIGNGVHYQLIIGIVIKKVIIDPILVMTNVPNGE